MRNSVVDHLPGRLQQWGFLAPARCFFAWLGAGTPGPGAPPLRLCTSSLWNPWFSSLWQWGRRWSGQGLGKVTYSTLFCWLFTIKDRCKQVRFQQTHNQGLRQLFLTVSWELCAYLCFSVVLEATQEASVQCQLKNPCPWRRRRSCL